MFSDFDYQLDRIGNRVACRELGGARVTWTYDASGQLTREHRSGAVAYDLEMSYDSVGNPIGLSADGMLTTRTYDAASQLLLSEDNAGRTTYSYDSAGNQNSVQRPNNERETRVWDAENRLTRTELPSGTVVTESYGYNGLRYCRQTATETTYFLWDDDRYLMELDAIGDAKVTYSSLLVPYGAQVSQTRHSGVFAQLTTSITTRWVAPGLSPMHPAR